MQARVRFVHGARSPLRRSCALSARSAGESAICPRRAQPSAEIARVECAKCRRECDLSPARATLCGDRARRVREMQARARFVVLAGNPLRSVECAKRRRERDWSWTRATLCGDRACRVRETQARLRARFVLPAGNPLRRSWLSSARNASEGTICPARGQPSAEIVRVACAKRRRERDLACARVRIWCASSARNAGDRARSLLMFSVLGVLGWVWLLSVCVGLICPIYSLMSVSEFFHPLHIDIDQPTCNI